MPRYLLFYYKISFAKLLHKIKINTSKKLSLLKSKEFTQKGAEIRANFCKFANTFLQPANDPSRTYTILTILLVIIWELTYVRV